MSGLEVIAVVACVGAVVSAYHDAAEILQQIKAKRKARKAARYDLLTENSTQELEVSLHRGEDVVQSQYDRDYRRFGAAFADGDEIARSALKDIIIHLQGQVIANLKIQWQQDTTYLDWTALQDVSDSSQDRAILVLMQLQQRIITSLPIEKIDLRPPPLFSRAKGLPPEPQTHYNESYDFRPNEYASVPPPSTCHPFFPGEYSTIYGRKAPVKQPNDDMIESSSSAGFIERQEHESASPPNRQNTTNGYVMQSQQQSLPFRCNEHPSNNGHSPSPSNDYWRTPLLGATNNGKSEKNEKSHFPLVKNLGLFGKKTRATSTDATKHDGSRGLHTQASALPKRLLSAPSPENNYVAIPSRKASTALPSSPNSYTGSRFSSISASTMTTRSSYEASEAPDFNPWAEQDRKPTPDSTVDRGKSKGSSSAQTLRLSGSIRRAPGSSMSVTSNPKDLLPSEANNYAGFCKGAWRAQIGDRKKAFQERQRPCSMYSTQPYWQCSKCKFEGRLIMLDKKTKGFDRRVMTADGIQFRWDFLFKSHIALESKDASPDFLSSTFGCMFCTAAGKGTPIFGGADMLMSHLQEHREHLPSGEVLYRTNCLVGPRASLQEDFDINLIVKDGTEI